MMPIKTTSLLRLTWRAYARAALLPLLLVEVVLVAIYLWTNIAIRDANIAQMRAIADQNLTELTNKEASAIRLRLVALERLTEVFRRGAERVVAADAQIPVGERERYAVSPEGVFHTAVDDGSAAAFFSAAGPVGESQRHKLMALARLDPLMIDTVHADPLIVQSYYNTHDSANRIYPYFDTASQYDSHMVIPEYNFYYEADAHHNPDRSVEWTDAYLDPAGKGWMVSVIAPVYREDFLEGVVGLDVTIETIVKQVLMLELPWGGYGVLLARSGVLLAMPEEAERDFGLRELKTFDYAEAVSEESLKPEAYRLDLLLPELTDAIERTSKGHQHVQLGGEKIASWHDISGTGWTLLTLVDEGTVYAQAKELEVHYTNLAYRMILLMVLFYVAFFTFLYWRAKRLAQAIVRPLERFNDIAGAIGRGDYRQAIEPSGIRELDASAKQLTELGMRLDAAVGEIEAARRTAETANREKSRFVSEMSHELRTPLNAVLGFAQLLHLSRERIDAEFHADIDEILASGRHLLNLVNDVLDLQRIESGGMALDMGVIDLQALTGECVDSMRPVLEAREFARMSPPQVSSTGCLAIGDRTRVRQILLNLLSNALKYGADDGRVEIEIGPGAVRDSVRVTVRDYGPGVPQSERQKIFEPFHRQSEHKDAEGAGIGLAVAKSLIERMGGRIGLQDTATGAAFWFELPAAVS